MTHLFNIYLNFYFFAIDTVQHNYILFTEAELSYSTQSSITVYPANAAIYSTQMNTCDLSLYLHTTDNQNLCQRRLLLHHKSPILQRYESTWIYHLPESQHTLLRCWKDKVGLPVRTYCMGMASSTTRLNA